MSTTDVVRLAPGDEEQLVDLFEAVLGRFDDLAERPGLGPRDFLADPGTFVFGAYVDEAPAGLAWGVTMRYPNGRLVSYLHELDVVERFRRRGIASSLVRSSMSLARARGHSRFWLSTGGHNEVAQALYDSLGGDRKPLGDVNYWWELGG